MPDALPLIPRPDGRLYRPRKVTAYPVGDDNGALDGVLVLGTHDTARALALATVLVTAELGRFYLPATPELVWVRDGMTGGERAWVPDEVNGRAGVLFREVEEMTPDA